MKRFTLLIAYMFFLSSCGGSPSISVQESKEFFEQAGKELVAKMDILWVVDNSGSMNDFQLQIEANFIAFMQNFSQKDFDFQMAVTVTDGWKDLDFSNYNTDGKPAFSGATGKSRLRAASDGTTRILTDSTPDVVNKFKQMVLVGTGGSGDERAFQSIEAAKLNPANAGFFRPDAHLAIIIVSDEEDTSWASSEYITQAAGCPSPPHDLSTGYLKPGCVSVAESVEYYKNFLVENSNDVLGATVHNMAIEEGDNTCRTSDANYNRYYGVRTTALANQTGGTVSSLCGNFSESLDNIAKKIIEKTVEFRLDKLPQDPTKLIVKVRGPGESDFVDVPHKSVDGQNGWTYNADANSVIFHGTAIPEQGSAINIEFDRGTLE